MRTLLCLALAVVLASCSSKPATPGKEVATPGAPSPQPATRTSSIVEPPKPRPATTQVLSRAEWGAPLVDVTRDGDNWVIAGQRQRVTLNPKNLSMTVRAGATTWSMVPSGERDLLVKTRGTEFPLRLADAKGIRIEPYDTGYKTGLKLVLSNWRRGKHAADVTLYLTICLEGKDEELVCDAHADERGETVVRQLDWPTTVDGRAVDHTLLSNHRGVLLPRDWPKPHFPIRSTDMGGNAKVTDTSEIQSHVIESWSMSWWGFQQGPDAMMCIVETPDDAAYQFDHPAGGPTVIGPRWRASLGRFRYPRSCRFAFIPKGNYGGTMAYMNNRLMPGHMIKNYRWLSDHGVRLDGTYLDVFGYVPPDEDFNAQHPTTRSDAIAARAKCYLWARNHVGFVGTEAACDWTVPYADISSPLGSTKGVPVPLFNLVYHDAIITPYAPSDLRGFLNGGLPQIRLSGEIPADEKVRIDRMRKLHQRLALTELTKHEFLDGTKYRVERSTFSDGTTVTVDWDKNAVTIEPDVNP